MPATLFVVASPLGNLEDVSARALDTLRSVTLIACEDTRRTTKLLARHGIRRPTVSCHRFNERERLEPILDRLREGGSVALVSDGGTPGVSDPGAALVRAALDRGVRVSPVPGPSAPAALLSVSGFSADRYVFEGFLPHRGGERRRRLRDLSTEHRTLVLFETPHRILAALQEIEEIFGPRQLVLGRELTKIHETILRGTAREVRSRIGAQPRGEITLIIEGLGSGGQSMHTEERTEETLAIWRKALEEACGDRRSALRNASKLLGLKRAELSRRLAELDDTTDDRDPL